MDHVNTDNIIDKFQKHVMQKKSGPPKTAHTQCMIPFI